jgi:hypothetical protein
VDFSRSVLNPILSDLRPIHLGLNRSVLNSIRLDLNPIHSDLNPIRLVLSSSVLSPIRSVLSLIRSVLNPIFLQAVVVVAVVAVVAVVVVAVVAAVAGIEIHLLDRMFSMNQIILHKQADERRDKNQNLANPMKIIVKPVLSRAQ